MSLRFLGTGKMRDTFKRTGRIQNKKILFMKGKEV